MVDRGQHDPGEYPHAVVQLVALGVGVSLLPPAAIRMTGGRMIGVATDPSIPRELMVITPLERAPSPAGTALLELLQSAPDAAETERRGSAPPRRR